MCKYRQHHIFALQLHRLAIIFVLWLWNVEKDVVKCQDVRRNSSVCSNFTGANNHLELELHKSDWFWCDFWWKFALNFHNLSTNNCSFSWDSIHAWLIAPGNNDQKLKIPMKMIYHPNIDFTYIKFGWIYCGNNCGFIIFIEI